MFARDADGVRIMGNKVQATGTDTQGPCGFVDGIRVYSTTSARVSNNTVRDFKSDGISFERGSRGRIDGNSVQFYHSSSTRDSDGDQGIRLVGGARAEVTGNVVRSLSTPATPHLEIGISLQDAAGGSDIHHNDLLYVKTGVGVVDSKARVRSNTLRGTGPATGLLYGIHLLRASGTEVLSNGARDFDLGIFVEATGAAIRNNVATGSLTRGCLDTSTGSGTATANTWTGNVGTPVSAPEAVCPAP
jgi:parallel beta-helix repeat protein